MPVPYSGDEGQSRYERMLQGYLSGELRIVNAGLPRSQKTLTVLLREEYPHLLCHDGSTQLIKRKELDYLASILDSGEQEALLLPMLIELGGDQSQATILCAGDVEEKVISTILHMPLRQGQPLSRTSAVPSTPTTSTGLPVSTRERETITLYRPQLALLRKRLKTTTQYLFSQKKSSAPDPSLTNSIE